jgi:hypothetical protein
VRKIYLSLLMAAVFGLGACGEEPPQADQTAERTGAEEPAFTEREQLHRAPASTVTERDEASPEQRLTQFFDALKANEPQQAAALVARQPLNVSEQELIESLKQWSGEIARQQQEFEILDSQQAGDFAIVRAQFLPMGGVSESQAVRPAVLFQEEGEWRVVWEVLGMEPDRVEDAAPALAQRLEPLYSWFSEQQRYGGTQQAGAAEAPDQQQAEEEQASGRPEGTLPPLDGARTSGTAAPQS